MFLKENISLFSITKIFQFLTKLISTFDWIYPANSTSFSRFELIKDDVGLNDDRSDADV